MSVDVSAHAIRAPEQWHQVLGVRADAGRTEIEQAFRDKMKTAHPDRGGSEAAAQRLTWARKEARKNG